MFIPHSRVCIAYYSISFTEVSSIAPNHPILNQDPKEAIPMLVDTLAEEDLVIVIESLHFLEKACKASESNHGFAVYDEMVKSLPLFNALVMVTYRYSGEQFKLHGQIFTLTFCLFLPPF